MAKMRDGAQWLSNHYAANDYYCEGEHVVGSWAGKGAEFFGIAGQQIEPQNEAFLRLFSGQTPEGEKLKPHESEIIGYDFHPLRQKENVTPSRPTTWSRRYATPGKSISRRCGVTWKNSVIAPAINSMSGVSSKVLRLRESAMSFARNTRSAGARSRMKSQPLKPSTGACRRRRKSMSLPRKPGPRNSPRSRQKKFAVNNGNGRARKSSRK